MMILFVISTLVIGLSAMISLQYANAASNDNSSCGQHHTSDDSKECSKDDTPFVLPFP
jgi:hypothetical protein